MRWSIDDPQCGAVTFVQRFGGSLNLNVHFHTLVLDGIGGTIEADGEHGAAIFRVFLPGARPTRPPSP